MDLNTYKIRFIIVTAILILTSLYSYAQSPIGAWERYYDDENGNSIRSVVISVSYTHLTLPTKA